MTDIATAGQQQVSAPVPRHSDVIILAGRSNPDSPDLTFGGQRAIDIIIAAVRNSFEPADLGQIIVAGIKVDGCVYVESGNGMAGSLENGLKKVRTETVLVLVGDIPFLKPHELTGFLKLANPGVLNIAIVNAEACAQAHPKLHRTTMTLANGRFTMGGAAFGPRRFFFDALPVAKKGYAARKSKAKLAVLLGPSIAWRYALSKKFPKLLSVERLEGCAKKLTGHTTKAVIGPWPGLGSDVDDEEQCRLAQAYFTSP